jgi:O-antigen/teichoic acid export membrane protein
MLGTGLGQILSFAFAPILTRLYAPAEFGLFGSFSSIAGILSSIVTLRYSEAIMLPESDEVAARLFLASCASAVLCTTIFSLLCLSFTNFWVSVLKAPELKGWLWLIPIAAVISGLNEMLVTWCSRWKLFKRTALSQIIRSLTGGSAQTAGGATGSGAGGLISGGLAGEMAANLLLWRSFGRTGADLLRRAWASRKLFSTAGEYRDFPLYTAPQHLASALSQGAPVLVLVSWYGAAIGGLYAFSIRVLQVPMNFVLTALRQVLFQKLSQVHNEGGDLLRLFKQTTGVLFLLASPPALIGMAAAPQVFAFVFGPKWAGSGEFARWLLFWVVPGFCNVPATLVGRILRKQRQLLVFDSVFLASRIVVLVWAAAHLTPVHSIIAFSVVSGIFNIYLIAYIWRVLQVHSKTSG